MPQSLFIQFSSPPSHKAAQTGPRITRICKRSPSHAHPRTAPFATSLRSDQTTPTPSLPPSVPTPTFDWQSQWYPLALVCDLSSIAPTRITILATHLVVWRSKTRWAVFFDRCPHRLAALSEGRIDEQGRLECGYHGWQFNGRGECTRIPQAAPSISSGRAATGLACAKSLVSRERAGILFVWMSERPPPSGNEPAVIQGARARYVTSAFSRTLPLCFTTLMQNVLDPAHERAQIHFAHHGQIGSRDRAAEIPIRIIQPASPKGFMADYYGGQVRLRFRPPSLVEIVTADGLSYAYYAVPIKSGLVRTIAVSGTAQRPIFLRPRWLDHLRRNKLVEGDLKLMMTQEAAMRREVDAGGDKSLPFAWRHFHMPTTADRLIVEMRRWLDVHAPHARGDWYGVYCGDGMELEEAIRRNASHVDTCSSCSGLVRTLERVNGICGGIAASLGVGCLIAPDVGQREVVLLAAMPFLTILAACELLRRRVLGRRI